jgi:hypothetical protein
MLRTATDPSWRIETVSALSGQQRLLVGVEENECGVKGWAEDCLDCKSSMQVIKLIAEKVTSYWEGWTRDRSSRTIYGGHRHHSSTLSTLPKPKQPLNSRRTILFYQSRQRRWQRNQEQRQVEVGWMTREPAFHAATCLLAADCPAPRCNGRDIGLVGMSR